MKGSRRCGGGTKARGPATDPAEDDVPVVLGRAQEPLSLEPDARGRRSDGRWLVAVAGTGSTYPRPAARATRSRPGRLRGKSPATSSAREKCADPVPGAAQQVAPRRQLAAESRGGAELLTSCPPRSPLVAAPPTTPTSWPWAAPPAPRPRTPPDPLAALWLTSTALAAAAAAASLATATVAQARRGRRGTARPDAKARSRCTAKGRVRLARARIDALLTLRRAPARERSAQVALPARRARPPTLGSAELGVGGGCPRRAPAGSSTWAGSPRSWRRVVGGARDFGTWPALPT